MRKIYLLLTTVFFVLILSGCVADISDYQSKDMNSYSQVITKDSQNSFIKLYGTGAGEFANRIIEGEKELVIGGKSRRIQNSSIHYEIIAEKH
jgi:hypothetical protein